MELTCVEKRGGRKGGWGGRIERKCSEGEPQKRTVEERVGVRMVRGAGKGDGGRKRG